MKRVLSVLASAAVVLSMAGCASSEGSSSQAESAASGTGTETSSEAAASLAEQPGESSKAEPAESESEPEMLIQKPKQVINETPASYESFGIDPAAKQDFIEKHLNEKGLPVFNITTKDSEYILSRDEYTSCVVDLFNCDEKYQLSDVSAGIKVRGNSSAYYGKPSQVKKNSVPYRIKFDEKRNVLGLNNGAECKSWVLHKCDWDVIRNDISLRFGREIIGDDTFCSNGQLCLVYVNDKYQDVYLLCEQCQVNPNRVDITEPEEGSTDLNIGYYLEIDNYAADELYGNYFTLDYGGYEVEDVRGTKRAFVPAEYSIKSDVYTKQQVDFISKYMKNLFDIVYLACEKGEYKTFDENYDLTDADFKSAQETVEAVMDIRSVVDLYLLYEIVHDYDCGEGSFYMCIDLSEGSKHPKLEFTSPWDFNWAFNDSPSRYWAAAFTEKSFVKKNGDRTNPWFVVLGKQEWFQKLASEKWTALNEAGAISGVMEFEKKLLEDYTDDLNSTNEYAVDSAYTLLEWIEKRLNWMDKTFKA